MRPPASIRQISRYAVSNDSTNQQLNTITCTVSQRQPSQNTTHSFVVPHFHCNMNICPCKPHQHNVHTNYIKTIDTTLWHMIKKSKLCCICTQHHIHPVSCLQSMVESCSNSGPLTIARSDNNNISANERAWAVRCTIADRFILTVCMQDDIFPCMTSTSINTTSTTHASN